MLFECDNYQNINYQRCCCLKHLVLLNEIAENQMMQQRYSILLLRTVNTLYKQGIMPNNTINIDWIKSFLDLITKYSSLFFLQGSKFIIIRKS
jgi:hypothetical protein